MVDNAAMTAESSDGATLGASTADDDRVAALDGALLGGQRRYTEADVVRESGTDLATARSLWRAMGFPYADPQAVAFTDADVQALRQANEAAQLVSDDVVAAVTRAMGRALSRLAEAEVEIIAEALAGSIGAEGDADDRGGDVDEQDADGPASVGRSTDDPVQLALQVARDRLPSLDDLLVYVWHRHLSAAAGRALAAPAGEGTAHRAVGFADLVGFTERVRDLDEDQLAGLIDRFERAAGDCVTETGGRVVKTVGDEVFFEADDPKGGAEIALRLAERHAADPQLPDVRVGLACGAVLARYGDVFGPVVNVAARLTALAHPGTVLVDRAAARTLDGDPAYAVKRLRPARVRGYHHLEASVLRRA